MNNLIEPPSLVGHFLAHPPVGFRTWTLTDGIPGFFTRFDLLTTMESSDRRRFASWPLHRFWRPYLYPHTAFVGTSCTEFALLPQTGQESFLRELLQRTASMHSFVIVKDIPGDPALVGEASQRVNQAFVAHCKKLGFVLLEGQALAYVPIDFTSTEEFLARLPRARRKDVRRKLKTADRLVIRQVRTGDAMFREEKVLNEFYALYKNVYEQSDTHFDLLSDDFFRAVLQDGQCGGIVFTYQADGVLIGYNLCFEHRGILLDKYLGLAYPAARDYNLYFISWFYNLEYALRHGLSCYVAGWTDPEIKRYLGARFTHTRHAVYIRNPVLRIILRIFKRFFEADAQWRQQTT